MDSNHLPKAMNSGKTLKRVAILDAFTANAYRGNPAAVVLSEEPLEEAERRNLAKELNQPAIAFVSHPLINSESFATSTLSSPPLIRWHTSTGGMLPLCGHATMAASCYLLDGHIFPRFGEIRYQFLLPTLDEEGAKSETAYELVASRSEDGRIEVTLPASFKAQPVPIEARDAIFKTLKAATGLESSEVEEMCLSPSNEPSRYNLTILLSRSVDLGALEVDSPSFLAIPYRGIYLTNLSPPSATIHYRCRVFFPSVGILEDHVCGSANTFLGPYYIERQSKTDSPLPEVVDVHQVSPRGGLFALKWNGKWGEEGGLVALRGSARLIMQGHLQA
ncbi:hypothetical protein JCM5350_006230 [Sporobolomyces pararoseus]